MRIAPWKRVLRGLALLLTLAVIVAGVWGAANWTTGANVSAWFHTNPSSTASATHHKKATPSPTPTPGADDALDDLLIQQYINVNLGGATYTGPLDTSGLIAFDIGFNHPVAPTTENVVPRKWSTSLCLPLTGPSAADYVASLQVIIWEDPFCGVTWDHFLANYSMGDVPLYAPGPEGTNTWLSPFTGDTLNSIPDQVAAFTKNASGNRAYQKLAALTNTLFTRFHAVTAKKLASTYDLRPAPGSVVQVGQLPVVITGHGDKLPVLVFQLTIKGACVAEGQFGANEGDARPEALKAPTCYVPPPPPPPHYTTTPHCTGTYAACHPIACPAGWTRHFWPDKQKWTCKSPYTAGPGSKGNAGQGAGTNHDKGPGKPTPRVTPTPTPTPTKGPPNEGGNN